jgi:hypothetical protein
MKSNFHYLIALAVVTVVITGCGTAKYTFNQTFGNQSEFGSFQSKVHQNKDSDILLANADYWVKDHLW